MMAGRPVTAGRAVPAGPVHAGRVIKVLSAQHIGDALPGIIDHHRQMIARRRVLAGKDHITPRCRLDRHRDRFCKQTFAFRRPVSCHDSALPICARARCMSRRSENGASLAARLLCSSGERTAASQDKRRTVGIPQPAFSISFLGRNERLDFSTGQIGGITGPCPATFPGQPGIAENFPIGATRLIERHAQPGEILEHLPFQVRRAPGLVDVFHPHEKRPLSATAARAFRRAESACPRCKCPLGEGAKRKYGMGHEIGKGC